MSDDGSVVSSAEESVSMSSGDARSSTCDTKSHASGTGSDGLAHNETRAVKRSKVLVLLVLLLAAAGCGTATFYYTKGEEAENFKTQFSDYAIEITDVSQHEAKSIFRSVKSTATTITSLVAEIDSSWPFVTVPHFEIRGMQVNELSGALITGFSPIVSTNERSKWETYSVENQGWISDGIGLNEEMHRNLTETLGITSSRIAETLYRYDGDENVTENSEGPYLPAWQVAPAPHDTGTINYNLLSHPVFSRVFHGMIRGGRAVLSEVVPLDFLFTDAANGINATHPRSFLFEPVYGKFEPSHNPENVKGVIFALLPWDKYFINLLPEGVNGLVVVLSDTCGGLYTYRVNGLHSTFVGEGDFHETKYDDLVVTAPFSPYEDEDNAENKEYCEFFLNVYPSSELEDTYTTNKPVLYTTVVILVFFFTSMVFVMYDFLVQRRQNKVMATAKRSNAIVSSLFPSNVRDRIMKEAEEQVNAEMNAKKVGFRLGTGKNKLKDFLGNGAESEEDAKHGVYGSKPIADLFPAATVMFADIVGFTAWSSVREPSQVFQLLETLYHAFDEIAKRRRVFKVETVGDCYVAVTGLPDPRKDHATVMARFARDCLTKMNDLSKRLEVSLGPDTGDLSMRVGLHSGPVTAGVLRGDKSRFQLFGDTVNTASRMESNGARNKIHISQETADLLKEAGKMHWIVAREDKILAKGKGELQTYWLNLNVQSAPSNVSGSTETSNSGIGDEVSKYSAAQASGKDDKATKTENDDKDAEMDSADAKPVKRILSDKVERLVHWNTDVLLKLLKQIVSRRNAIVKQNPMDFLQSKSLELDNYKGETVFDEVKDVIKLPKFDAKIAKRQEDPNNIELNPKVTAQLHDYVTVIATMYRDNPFHNFEHASHVTMSVVKLLSRIVAPDDEIITDVDDDNELVKNLHDHTYGITSDPLTQFAVVFSALIHDVDHSGVPNAQLVKEQASIASIYKNKSVAEQNSVDIAWDLLMDNSFKDLRAVIYSTSGELKRFRQLVVNTVMATDIVDKELKELRNARWEKAFHDVADKESREDVNRKATIVIEHLIQASDVAHTMQHWHIYRKWNERFFHENIHAYRVGRAEKDPAEFWYKGEIGFFDFYIIPLARKLKDCGVFGVSSDEYLNYALTNRKEWELKGKQVVADMVEKYKHVNPVESQLGETETLEEKLHVNSDNH